MHFEQLVTTVADGSVDVQGLTPELDQDLMYRLMKMAPACDDMEDHYFPAYTCLCIKNRFIVGRSFLENTEKTQTNYIIGSGDQLPNFKNNPALFAFIANAEGLLHDKRKDCPKLPVLDFEHGASRFAPVFENDAVAELAKMTLETIEKSERVAVLGIKNPFRFLVPLYNMLPNDRRSQLSCSVNSSLQPKDDQLELFVFPSTSRTLLEKLEAANINTISLRDLAKV